MLNDPQYFQAVYHTLPLVKTMLQAQVELGMANEELARMYETKSFFDELYINTSTGNNLAMQEQLYQLRTETKEAYDDAKAQEARFRVLEKEQRDLYQVRET